jgi:uncharacterized protein (TIGR02145 family)
MKNILLSVALLFVIGLIGVSAQTVTDVDGNVYNIVTIGTQVWMAENLKTTKYSNSDLIGTTTTATLDIPGDTTFIKSQWAYDGDERNAATYGRLYTWYAISDSRNVCPTGWHVPTNVEWTILEKYLINNGYSLSEIEKRNIVKSLASTSGWDKNETTGTPGNDQSINNSSGFTAIPYGYREVTGVFIGFGECCNWWSVTESDTYALSRSFYYYDKEVSRRESSKLAGLSVRCLRDN